MMTRTDPAVWGCLFAVLPLGLGQKVYKMSDATENTVSKVTVSILGKTYTLEELESKENVKTAARVNLPNDKLLALAAKYPPPPEWLKTVEEKPF